MVFDELLIVLIRLSWQNTQKRYIYRISDYSMWAYYINYIYMCKYNLYLYNKQAFKGNYHVNFSCTLHRNDSENIASVLTEFRNEINSFFILIAA